MTSSDEIRSAHHIAFVIRDRTKGYRGNCHQIARDASHMEVQNYIFLDINISKALDRVWHDGLAYKLKRCDVSGPLLALIQSFSLRIESSELF